jgi:hypothetical protein
MRLLIFDDYDPSNLIECSIEVYHCSFSKFESHLKTIRDHYSFNHQRELELLPGVILVRKIVLLTINGEKSFIKRYF